MIAEQDVKTYTRNDVYWLEAANDVNASSSKAWHAIELLIVRLSEDGTSAHTEFVIDQQALGDDLVAEGTQIAALATVLGIFNAAAPHHLRRC